MHVFLLISYTSMSLFFFSSDESLLQEDNAEVSSLNSEFANCVRLTDPSDEAVLTSGIGRYAHNQAYPSTKFLSSNQRYEHHLFPLVVIYMHFWS